MNLKDLLALDRRTSDRFRLNPEQRGLWYLAAFFAHSGDSWWWLIALLAVWLTTSGFWHKVSALLAIGVLVLAILIFGIKWIFRRRRPKGDWGKIYRQTDPHSFPSGHAARSFALAVMALGWCPLWLGLLLIFWAPLVCIARVLMGVHYLSDVIVGALIGIIWGIIMLAATPLLLGLFPIIFIK
jgi:undecaprenyl-diphosphatase